MSDLEPMDIEKIIEPPFSRDRLAEKANRYKTSFDRLISQQTEPSPEQLRKSYDLINQWLNEAENRESVSQLIKDAVNLIKESEGSFLSESHDLLHLTEMATGLLDDKARGVDTDDAAVLLTTVVILLHDIGRHTEKKLTNQQLDLSTELHHDTFTYRAARKILAQFNKQLSLPQQIRDAFSQLIFTGLRKFGKVGEESFFAITNDTDRRQILGSPTVGRDILYFGGMEEKDLSPNSILDMPPGYTHYDSGGFFGQQNTMSRAVFRDQSIRETRKLDEVYDSLAIESAIIMLLACGDNQELEQRAFDIDLGLIETPSQRLTDEKGRPWWPKKPLPSPQILAQARQEKQAVEEVISEHEISVDDLAALVKAFLTAYSTIIETEHLAKVLGNISRFTSSERLRWARVIYYAHRKNQERYSTRIEVFQQEIQNNSFIAQSLAPFVRILENKKVQEKQVSQLFQTLWPK